jgi:hypothetical protein
MIPPTAVSNISKKPHWFESYQEDLINDIKLKKTTEKKELKQEKRALKILNKLPEDLLQLCLEFLDEKNKRKYHITKITNLFKKYVGSIENLNSNKYEDYPIYKLLETIPEKKLIKFIKCGTPSRYYQKIINNTLFNSFRVKNAFYRNLVDRYKGRKLSYDVCAWEITKLIRFSFKEIMIEGENLFNTDYKKYKEYDLHFKKYEKFTVSLLNSIVYLHKKYSI